MGVEQPCYIVILQIMWTEQIVFRESFRQIYELMDKLPIIAFKKNLNTVNGLIFNLQKKNTISRTCFWSFKIYKSRCHACPL